MSEVVDRDSIVRKIAGSNEHALRMGIMFNKQTLEPDDKPATTVDLPTESAMGIMSASGEGLAEDEVALVHLLDGLNWSENQVGSFLEVLAKEG